ncbi:putative F-box protein At1g32020 [Impatiens glandulifera]|uniref:putative F-box protein At1g32020 n=1 Tax=Impatiens glandulifera TaxID=253017 RepID=UPI001FB094D4|nr:putative F-box protein At1g32020 [Impatiens glandulifera]
MSRGHKAPKLTETTNDYISELPNDILSMITCKLDLKDAVRTSILSKRWKYIWINHTDLIFNHLNVLGLDRKKLMEDSVGADSYFVKYVDQTMQQRFKGDGKINSFRVSFGLGKFFSESIDRWISCALGKGVETIDLDFSKLPSSDLSSSFQKCYNFPWLLTISEDKGTLKYLRVAGCRLQLVPASCSMKFD